MTTKKDYTNADLWKKMDGMESRVRVIEDWKSGIEIGKAAVSEYILQQATDKTNSDRDSMFKSIKDITPYVILVLAAVAAFIASHGGK